MKKKLLLLITTFCLANSLVGCSKNEKVEEIKSEVNDEPLSKQTFLLDTIITIKLYDKKGEKILDGAFDLIEKLETNLSSHKDDGALKKLNEANGLPTKLNSDAITCIQKAIQYSELSNGVFDVSVGAVSLLWDFSSGANKLPDDKKIKDNLKYINYKDIKIEGDTVTLKPNMKIDLGAIAKGYIADKIKDYLVKNEVKSAIINLGGNVLTIGKKYNSPFKIGVQNPLANRNEILGVVDIENKSVVTSGTYERFIEVNGKKYHHILNPKTGYPNESDILQTTILSDKSIDGDALSTTFFLLGKDKGLELANSIDGVEACFYLKDGNIVYSKGFKKLEN